MRIFIALELEQAVREKLKLLQDQLRPFVQRANFSRPENFHITLRFLGECPPRGIDAAIGCIQRVAAECSKFQLESYGLGCFQKKRDICFAAIREHPQLQSVYRALQDELWSNRLILQKESYTPHITLAREVVWNKPFPEIVENIIVEPVLLEVNGLSLMESTRMDGRLCYLPVAYHGFSKGRVGL